MEGKKFKLGDIVYLITDREQHERIVTGIQQRPNGFTYALSLEINETWHYEFEITQERDTLKSVL